MKQWWLHFSKEMPRFEPVWEEKEEVEYETGRLPFLLRQLNRFSGKSYTSIRNEFMSCQIFMDLRGNVSKLVRRILTEADGNPEGRSTYVNVNPSHRTILKFTSLERFLTLRPVSRRLQQSVLSQASIVTVGTSTLMVTLVIALVALFAMLSRKSYCRPNLHY